MSYEESLTDDITKEIMRLHNKGLTIYYISTKLRVRPWEVKGVIKKELRQDYDSLFKS